MEKKSAKIDLVVPYVNNKDIVWQQTYIEFCKKYRYNEKIVEMYGSRYGGITFIYDMLKLAKKNMPWIKKIFLLLSNEEQIDKSLLPDNVEIVLHKDFIPKAFLPTFNSTTIEMFLYNIQDLGEYFIYANDDMLPTGKMKPTDFFENGKIKIQWRRALFTQNLNMFSYQCRNNCVSICKKLGFEFDNVIVRPVHSYTPMIKSHCKEAFDTLHDLILPYIWAFRTTKQHNQYIYPLFEYAKYGTLDSNIDFYYTEMKDGFDLKHQIVCVNAEKKNENLEKFKEEIRKLCK